MAIENFDEKNIQDTFQRVVQTDGTNQLADGTGSIFTPISSSHAITSSHALFAVSASHEITIELSSSHAINADSSSRGEDFKADLIQVETSFGFTNDDDTYIYQTGPNTISLFCNDDDVFEVSSTLINANKNFNVLGNISSSGEIIGIINGGTF